MRRRRWLTASSVVAVAALVALVVGFTGVFGTGRSASEPPPAAPPTVAPAGGLALGVDQARRFVLEKLAHPATARILSLGPGASGQVRAGGIAANLGAGWVVVYTSTAAGKTQAATRFAVVDLSGGMHPFGPAFPALADVGGFDVAPDGSRLGLVLSAPSGLTPPKIQVIPLPGRAGAIRQWSVRDRTSPR